MTRRRNAHLLGFILGLFLGLIALVVVVSARFTYRHLIRPLWLWLHPTCVVFYRRWVFTRP